ncbi:hypothetical protein [Sphingomonas sp. SRS2]|uniref:hypothetical protein n=1 Tax=Sphingomonas sp. SRS2 TaxID=133190 RepID=UPI0006184640|nr:hypothetical protein [Sphingomonas sp. SRS2]KKC27141.1 hypothetical protein WP12_04965 [Sphingomonas sp. SRS2]
MPVVVNATDVYGIGDLTTGYHRWLVDIQKDYITIFIDGLEVYQAVNPFHRSTWYPIMNVAVKTPDTLKPYDDGSGEMRVRSLKVWEN